MLYTTLPEEQIFMEANWTKNKPNKKMIAYQGINVEVELLDSGEYKVERIISSNPNDYLISSLQPGVKLAYF